MKIKGLNLSNVVILLFSSLFLLINLSCRSKTIDLRIKDGGTVEEPTTNPSDPGTPSEGSGVEKLYIKVVSGSYHNCAITKSKHVVCWGSSAYGQVGFGAFKHDSPARLVKTDESHLLSDVDDIVAGNYHNCALLKDKTVKCWGYNRDHQLGNGGSEHQYYAVNVKTDEDGNPNLSGVESIVVGEDHTCAIWNKDGDNGLRCWGKNSGGQLGNNNDTNQSYAVDVKTDAGASNLKDVIKMSIGESHNCVITGADKKVKCWGANASGQLGDGTKTSKYYAVNVEIDDIHTLLENAKDISVKRASSCAVLDNEDNNVKCWGSNSNQQIGSSHSSSLQLYAIDVEVEADTILTNVEKIILGPFRACVVLKDDTAKCWGSNSYGQAGNGNTSNQVYATSVKVDEDVILTDVKDMKLATNYTCAVLKNGNAKCWGLNSSGMLGDGTTTNRSFATSVKVDADNDLSNVEDISLRSSNVCTLLKDHSIKCFGSNNAFALGYGYSTFSDDFIQIPELSNKHISKIIRMGSDSSMAYCVLSSLDGTVQCWGNNTNGKLGNGTTDDILEPTYVKIDADTNLTGVKDLIIGDDAMCAIVGDEGFLKCWGRNEEVGQLGSGDYEEHHFATDVVDGEGTPIEGVKKAFINGLYGCALLGVDNEVKCWGDNTNDILGNNTHDNTNYAVNVKTDEDGNPNLTGVKDIYRMGDSPYNFNCAIMENDKSLRCWGFNVSGELGVGNNSEHNVATNVRDNEADDILKDVEEVVNNGSNTCAIVGNSRKLKCWGNNSNGVLGTGDSGTKNEATNVVGTDGSSDLTNVQKVIIASHTCALLESKTVKCWGEASNGQIGNSGVAGTAVHAYDVLNEDNSPLSKVSDFKIVDNTTCAISNGEVKCWGKGNNALLLNDHDISYAKNILNLDGTLLSNVKSIELFNDIGYALLNDNTLKHWGDIDNSIVSWGGKTEGKYTKPNELDKIKTTAQSILSKANLEPMIVSSESMIKSSNSVMFISNEDKFYFRGFSNELKNFIPTISSYAKTIDDSLVK